MQYSKTTLMELSHKYRSILKKCAVFNAAILIGGIFVACPALAGNPNTTGNAWVFGDISLANAPVSQAAIGGRRMAWNSAGTKYKNDMPKYNMLGRSLSVIGSEMYVGPVKLTLRELEDNDVFTYNYQWDENGDGENEDVDIAKWAEITWDDALGESGATDIATRVAAKIGPENARYTAPGVYMFAQRDASKKAGSMSFNNSTLTVNGSTVNAETLSIMDSNLTVVNQDKLTLDAFNGGDIDSDGVTTLNVGEMTFVKSKIYVNENASLVINPTKSATFQNSVIVNNGVVHFKGDVTLDGGISGNGNGSVTFASGTSLTAELQKTTISANTVIFEGNNVLNLIVANGLANADYDFIKDGALKGVENVTIADNAVYNLRLTDAGKINVSVKSGSEIIESIDAPVTKEEGETLSAVIASNGNGTALGNQIAQTISSALQTGNATAAVQAARDLAPTTSQQVVGVTKDVISMLSNVASDRINPVGLAGGDVFEGFGMWGQGLYNRSKQDATASSEGFRANTRGIAVGLDGKFSKAMTVGVGYGYTDTDADAGARDVDVEGHHVFLYGQYKPSQWYANWLLDYGYAKYDETKTPAGLSMKTSYHVHSYAAHYMTGYDFENGLMTEVGARYLLVDQDAYNDGLQRIKSDKNDTLTAVAGVKYQAVVKTDDVTFVPRLRLAATYDVKSEDSEANVQVVGGGNYQITGERLHRFGVEAGVGVTATVGAWDVSLDYFGGYRKDYQSHTGLLKAQYNF